MLHSMMRGMKITRETTSAGNNRLSFGGWGGERGSQTANEKVRFRVELILSDAAICTGNPSLSVTFVGWPFPVSITPVNRFVVRSR